MPTCYSRDDFQGRKFIFIHTPKTAGVSMTAVLEGHVEPYESDLGLRNSILDRSSDLLGRYQGILFWHITVGDLRAFYGDAAIDEFYSFAFIRNPWDWLVSMYSFIRDHKDHPESMICGHMTFKQFVRYFLAKNVSQHSFFAIDGKPAVSQVFRLEDLAGSLADISRQTGLPLKDFPVENTSVHKRYADYYDGEDVELVRAAFVDDIALGEYEFECETRVS